MNSFNRLTSARYGQMIYNVHDRYVGRSLELYGEFSEGEVEVFRQLVAPGDLVLDIGANIGAHTVFFAGAVGPSGVVLAFEPQRIIYQTLCGNMALNSIQNAYCFHAAVGAAPGHIVVPQLDFNRSNNFGGLELGAFTEGDRVQIQTIDGLRLGRCKFIKVDVEGMELEVLRGCVQTIERLKPVIYVENDRPEKSDALVRFIHSLGYRMLWHHPCLYNPQNHLGNSTNVFGSIASHNMLCFPITAKNTLIGFEPVGVPV
jgi:FkbM family methyltransferase